VKKSACVLIIGIATWLVSAYYPWPATTGANYFMLDKSMATTLGIKPPVDYYSEVKFWAEKAGQILSGLGTILVLIKTARRKKG
jgi:hypothetical protein